MAVDIILLLIFVVCVLSGYRKGLILSLCTLLMLALSCLGAAAVGYRTESMHGAGSPQAQRIMIQRQGNIEGKKELAKAIAGIK